jgi:hypothetical protein
MLNIVARALMAGLVLLGPAGVAAQEMYVYPNANQTPQQLETDKQSCHDWSVKQTGVDPEKMATEQQQKSSGGPGGTGAASVGIGAARGAAQGDAAAGAMHGIGMAGLMRTIRARRQMDQQHDQYMQEHQTRQTQLQNYDRAYTACLTARGYTVR